MAGDDEKADRPEQCILLVSLARMWMTGMHIIIITVPAVAGERRCWCRRCHYQRVMMKCTALQDSLSVGLQWHPFLTISGVSSRSVFRGIYDAFRQPKYAYYAFRSQSAATLKHPVAECGPMVFIAHEMSPFSDADVVVFSNCDSVPSVYDDTEAGRFRWFMRRDICLMPR